MIYLLFDIDNTLLKIEDGVDEDSSRVMFKKIFNIDADESYVETYSKTEKCIINDVLKKFGQTQTEIGESAYQEWGRALKEILNKKPAKILPGINELLTNLSTNPKIKICLLTGNSVPRSESKLSSVKLDNFFRDYNTGKLRGVFGEISLQRVDLLKFFRNQIEPNDKMIVVDDSLMGAKMSKEQNVPVISVATGKIKEEEFAPFTSYVFPDFGENRWKQVLTIIESV